MSGDRWLAYRARKIGCSVDEIRARDAAGHYWCSLGRHWTLPNPCDQEGACRRCHLDMHLLTRRGDSRAEARAALQATSISIPCPPPPPAKKTKRCNRCGAPFAPTPARVARCQACDDFIRDACVCHTMHGREIWG